MGDGDTSSFKAVVDFKPNEKCNITPTILECVGHVQKRLGAHLRNKVKEYKSTSIPVGARGQLNEKTINSMQNFHGLAIRQNLNDKYEIKKAIGAILFLCTDITDTESRHHFRPPGEDSWWKYKKDIVTGKSTYRKTINLPKWIYHIIRPVFDALADDDVLSKCFHGETQNPNEAFNNVVWTRCPKTIYVSRSIMELGVNSAVLHYNEVACGISKVFSYFKIDNGYYMEKGSIKRNIVSIGKMDIKSSEDWKIFIILLFIYLFIYLFFI